MQIIHDNNGVHSVVLNGTTYSVQALTLMAAEVERLKAQVAIMEPVITEAMRMCDGEPHSMRLHAEIVGPLYRAVAAYREGAKHVDEAIGVDINSN